MLSLIKNSNSQQSLGDRKVVLHNLKLIGFSVGIWVNVSMVIMLVNLIDL
jgi:hypothetical protein